MAWQYGGEPKWMHILHRLYTLADKLSTLLQSISILTGHILLTWDKLDTFFWRNVTAHISNTLLDKCKALHCGGEPNFKISMYIDYMLLPTRTTSFDYFCCLWQPWVAMVASIQGLPHHLVFKYAQNKGGRPGRIIREWCKWRNEMKIEEVKRPAATGSRTQDTSGLSRQCSATVSWVWLPATAGLFTFLYFRLSLVPRLSLREWKIEGKGRAW